MFDVIIIGAGPAGTAAAVDLLNAGAGVLILDKTDFPRKKACAGGITPKAFRLFRYDITPVVRQICHRVKITRPHGGSFEINAENPLCHMTRREELDYFSLKKVIRMGGRFRVVKKISRIVETPSAVTVETEAGIFKAFYLVGADGANSRVRRLTGPHRFWHRQHALEADVYVDKPERFDIEFDFCGLKSGYQWIFPKGDHVNVGLYASARSVKLKTKQLMEYVEKRFGVHTAKAIRGYPICTGGFLYHPSSTRVFLAGDAAGLAERLLGEGIYFALKSGQQAAQSIINALGTPAFSAVPDYYQRLAAIRKDLRICHFGAAFFYKFPKLSLALLSSPRIHQRLTRGFADGKTISQIVFRR